MGEGKPRGERRQQDSHDTDTKKAKDKATRAAKAWWRKPRCSSGLGCWSEESGTGDAGGIGVASLSELEQNEGGLRFLVVVLVLVVCCHLRSKVYLVFCLQAMQKGKGQKGKGRSRIRQQGGTKERLTKRAIPDGRKLDWLGCSEAGLRRAYGVLAAYL
jgi:hypothetical protein